MSLRKYFSVILTASLLVTLTDNSSFAFSITLDQTQSIKDSDRTYQYEQYYEYRQGVTRLDAWPGIDPRRALNKGQVVEIRSGGTDGLLNLLNQTFEYFYCRRASGFSKSSFRGF
jgi:hypothetical protein